MAQAAKSLAMRRNRKKLQKCKMVRRTHPTQLIQELPKNLWKTLRAMAELGAKG